MSQLWMSAMLFNTWHSAAPLPPEKAHISKGELQHFVSLCPFFNNDQVCVPRNVFLTSLPFCFLSSPQLVSKASNMGM